MVRKITLALSFATLLLARQASAVPVVATDLDTFLLGDPFGDVVTDLFTVADPLPPTMGTIENSVYFDGTNYAYVHTVTPDLANNIVFNTEFDVAGFTGVAGWSFGQASLAGGSGTGADFFLDHDAGGSGQLNWVAFLGASLNQWDSQEPITFFFVSTRPPTIGDYNLISSESGTAQSLAPVPEPGSIALFGSGLVGLYAAMRRRRSLKM